MRRKKTEKKKGETSFECSPTARSGATDHSCCLRTGRVLKAALSKDTAAAATLPKRRSKTVQAKYFHNLERLPSRSLWQGLFKLARASLYLYSRLFTSSSHQGSNGRPF